MVLRVRGSTGSLGKLTLQRDCGVSWRYQAITLTSRTGYPREPEVRLWEVSCATESIPIV